MNNTTILPKISSIEQVFGNQCSREEALKTLKKYPDSFAVFSSFKPEHQNNILHFMQGLCSLDITMDKFFLHIMNPKAHPERLESFLTSLLHDTATIKEILPREGMQLAENGSLVIMDIIVELSDGSTVDVEMQKVGYHFPGQRSDCYSADMIIRQYNRIRGEKSNKFSYKDLKPVHLFILMEKSPQEFHKFPDQYIHEKQVSYSSGLTLPSLSHITYISLDTFNSIVQNVNTELDAWLTFFSCTDSEHILKLIQRFPKFLDYYKDIAIFRTQPEEMIKMFSEALDIMDRNTANLMIDELMQENEQMEYVIAEKDNTIAEKDNTIADMHKQIEELKKQLENNDK